MNVYEPSRPASYKHVGKPMISVQVNKSFINWTINRIEELTNRTHFHRTLLTVSLRADDNVTLFNFVCAQATLLYAYKAILRITRH